MGMMGGGGGAGLGRLAGCNKLTIQQKVQMLEAVSMGCIEQPNSYDVFDQNNQKIFVVEEKSGQLTRCCCAPDHTLSLQVHQVDPMGNKVGGAMTIDRPGCVFDKPCIGNAALMDACLQEITVLPGIVEGDPGDLPKQMQMGGAKMPTLGGCTTPTLDIFDAQGAEVAKIEAGGTCPSVFGGCTEFCCDQPYNVMMNGQQIGAITKMKPKNMESAMAEMFTDADTFSMEFPPDLPVEQKARLLASLLLLDYMFFERDVDFCSMENGGIAINVCNVYCMGMIFPCKIQMSGGEGGEN